MSDTFTRADYEAATAPRLAQERPVPAPRTTTPRKREERTWTEAAACRSHPHPEWWINGSNVPEATAICRGCPVLADCDAYARRSARTEVGRESILGQVLAGHPARYFFRAGIKYATERKPKPPVLAVCPCGTTFKVTSRRVTYCSKDCYNERSGGRWSIAHDACILCGTTRRPHASKGRCTACRNRQDYRRSVTASEGVAP